MYRSSAAPGACDGAMTPSGRRGFGHATPTTSWCARLCQAMCIKSCHLQSSHSTLAHVQAGSRAAIGYLSIGLRCGAIERLAGRLVAAAIKYVCFYFPDIKQKLLHNPCRMSAVLSE